MDKCGLLSLVAGGSVGTWTLSINPYPTPVLGESCGIDSGYIYCVAGVGNTSSGDVNVVYYSSVSNGKVGSWTVANTYPIDIGFESCAMYSGYIYCVGGSMPVPVPPGGYTNAVYYAHVVPTKGR